MAKKNIMEKTRRPGGEHLGAGYGVSTAPIGYPALASKLQKEQVKEQRKIASERISATISNEAKIFKKEVVQLGKEFNTMGQKMRKAQHGAIEPIRPQFKPTPKKKTPQRKGPGMGIF